MDSSCQRLWHDKPIPPHALARQSGSRVPPRQLGLNPVATVTPFVVPLHMARQCAYAALRVLARREGLWHENTFSVE
jgi:hypothetical protein